MPSGGSQPHWEVGGLRRAHDRPIAAAARCRPQLSDGRMTQNRTPLLLPICLGAQT
jgi:hypothetical protein